MAQPLELPREVTGTVPGCIGCGGEVPASRGTKPRRWCSESCRVRNYYQNHPDKREKKRLADQRRHRKAFVPKESKHEHVCLECANLFVSNHRKSKYCSIRCAGRASRRVRRARSRGVRTEEFSYLEIAERDGWICQLCHEPVDPWAEKPDPMRGSLDHDTPISRGGENTRENIQLAHLSCNCSKRDRMN